MTTLLVLTAIGTSIGIFMGMLSHPKIYRALVGGKRKSLDHYY